MKIKTNLLEEYIKFNDNTKKQNKIFEIRTILFVNILCLFLFFILFKKISKYSSYNYKNTSIRIHVIVHY